MTDPLNRLLKIAIVKYCIKSESRQMINDVHSQSIKAMPEVMWIMFETSFAHVFQSDEGPLWQINIDFPVCLSNEESIMTYAKAVYTRTGLSLVKVCCADLYWVYRVLNP